MMQEQMEEQGQCLGVVRAELRASESREKAAVEEVRRMVEKLREKESEVKSAEQQLQDKEEALGKAKTSQHSPTQRLPQVRVEEEEEGITRVVELISLPEEWLFHLQYIDFYHNAYGHGTSSRN